MLTKIAAYLRAMQLYYQACHNLVKGVVFNQDHGTFSSFYDAAASDYDAVIERAINIEGDQAADLVTQMKEVYTHLKGKPCCGVAENKVYFVAALDCEKTLCQMIEAVCKDPTTSEGTRQLLGDIVDKSEVRQYLIQRRIK